MNAKLGIFFLLLIILGCSKTNVQPTSLKITVVDNLANPVNGATVTLYGSEHDYLNQTNPIGAPVTTGADGVAQFSAGLMPLSYYWVASKGCTNNWFGTITTSGPLIANTVYTVNSIIADTGILTFVNTSTNPYAVYLFGESFGTAAPGATLSYHALAGSYSIRVVQQSGYALTPTDETYNGNLNCGGALTTTFP
jgi:hypothetical protein